MDEAQDVPKEKIENLLEGVDTDDDSSEAESEKPAEPGELRLNWIRLKCILEGPIEIDSTEEVIKLDDSDDSRRERRKRRSIERRDNRRDDRRRSRDRKR